MKSIFKLVFLISIALCLASCDASFWEGDGNYSYNQPFFPNDNHIDYHHNHRRHHWSNNGIDYHHFNGNNQRHHHKNRNHQRHQQNGGRINYHGNAHHNKINPHHKNHKARNDLSGKINIHVNNNSEGFVAHSTGLSNNNMKSF